MSTHPHSPLDKLAKTLTTTPGLVIEIAGHTDNVGDRLLNQSLSENRAQIIRNYLTRYGIADSRLRPYPPGRPERFGRKQTREPARRIRCLSVMNAFSATESTPMFVPPGSIIRRIWSDADVILLIFGGAAAEFALNRAVDWLFFTGKLPADPIARLFSTVQYAQKILLATDVQARVALSQINKIHGGVEQKRGRRIPDWAYRDVLYMLIDYSERAYQLLHRPLTDAERNDMFIHFREVGTGLNVSNLPTNYADWKADRQAHLDRDLIRSEFTDKLFRRYREQLGGWRYNLLRQAQAVLVPERVSQLLDLPEKPLLAYSIGLYKILNVLQLRSVVQRVLLPTEYLAQIRRLDVAGL